MEKGVSLLLEGFISVLPLLNIFVHPLSDVGGVFTEDLLDGDHFKIGVDRTVQLSFGTQRCVLLDCCRRVLESAIRPGAPEGVGPRGLARVEVTVKHGARHSLMTRWVRSRGCC